MKAALLLSVDLPRLLCSRASVTALQRRGVHIGRPSGCGWTSRLLCETPCTSQIESSRRCTACDGISLTTQWPCGCHPGPCRHRLELDLPIHMTMPAAAQAC